MRLCLIGTDKALLAGTTKIGEWVHPRQKQKRQVRPLFNLEFQTACMCVADLYVTHCPCSQLLEAYCMNCYPILAGSVL